MDTNTKAMIDELRGEIRKDSTAIFYAPDSEDSSREEAMERVRINSNKLQEIYALSAPAEPSDTPNVKKKTEDVAVQFYSSLFLINRRYNRVMGFIGNVKIAASGAIVADRVECVKAAPSTDLSYITAEQDEGAMLAVMALYKKCTDRATNINRTSYDLILKFTD